MAEYNLFSYIKDYRKILKMKNEEVPSIQYGKIFTIYQDAKIARCKTIDIVNISCSPFKIINTLFFSFFHILQLKI